MMMVERSKRSRDDGRRYEDMMRLWRSGDERRQWKEMEGW